MLETLLLSYSKYDQEENPSIERAAELPSKYLLAHLLDSIYSYL